MMSNTTFKSLVDDLNTIGNNLFGNLPLAFIILGLIGFIGNLLTYLQPEFRKSTCSIYNLCGSIADIITLSVNQFPYYLMMRYGLFMPWYSTSALCKSNLFLLVFLPHLSTIFLLMSIIDRYGCTCSASSLFYKLNRLKMVPSMIIICIFVTGLSSIYAPLTHDLIFPMWCSSTNPTATSVFYITLIGLLPPIVMLIFVFLTYRNIHLSRRRVAGGTTTVQPHRAQKQLIIIVFAQILVTAFLALQWMIFFIYMTITANQSKTFEEYAILNFVMSLTNNVYYLNNVKSFYISLLISRLFRQMFFKALLKLIPQSLRPQLELLKTRASANTVTKVKRGPDQSQLR